MAYIISADDLKKMLPGYDPAHSEDVHRLSARLADQRYEEALRERPEHRVVLMAGGTASGKSEYVSAYLDQEEVIIFDGTLPSREGARIKIRAALRAGKNVEIRLVIPADLAVAFVVFLNRERKLATRHFFRTHAHSRKTVLEIAEEYPAVSIRIIESSVDFVGTGGRMAFREIELTDRSALLDFLRQNQYTEEQLRSTMYHGL